MRRLFSSLSVLAFLAGISLVTVSASPVNTPTVSGLNQYVVPNGFGLVISGAHFADDATGKCDAGGGTPTVHFTPVGGGSDQAVTPDGAHCSNNQVTVPVPAALAGAATVTVTDTSNHTSAQKPQVTIQPIASLSRSTGDVSSGPLQVIGSNLQPPNLAPGSALQLTFAGAQVGYSGLTNTGLSFNPGNQSGGVQLSVQVCDNGDDNCARRDTATVNAGSYTFQPPALDAVNLAHQVVGSRVSLTGQNLGSGLGTVTFVGAAPVRAAAWGPGSLSATVPPGAQSGAISVSVPGFGSVGGPTIGLDPKLTGLSPNSGSANQQVHVSGFNFGNAQGTVSVGSTAQAISSWADQGVTFTIGPDTDGGDATLARADGATVDIGNLGVVPHLDKTESNNVPAGAQVVVDGISLGANQGTAKLGSADATPLLWSRDSVLLQLPTTIAAGTYPLVVTSATGATSNAVNLTVVAGPSPKATAAAHGGQAVAGAPVAPSFDNNHDFVKPIKPPSPVYFNVTVDPHKVKAGDLANITVTLKLNDKPVKGAAVKLAMLFTPGDDYKFAPDSGVTDDNGVFTATIKTSKNPGDSVVAATSGVFSDQDHVLGTAANGKVASVTQAAPNANGGFAPLLLLGLVAVALVAAGFYLNMRSMGR